jgi:hypothetical protein
MAKRLLRKSWHPVFLYFRVASVIAWERAKPLLRAVHSSVCVARFVVSAFACLIAYECGKQLLYVRGEF